MKEEFQVYWTESAAKDLENIILYIAADKPEAAKNLFRKIKNTASDLHHLPQRGLFVPELQSQGILLYRERVVPPLRIVYRVEEGRVFVMSVFDSRQNIEDILFKKMLNQAG